MTVRGGKREPASPDSSLWLYREVLSLSLNQVRATGLDKLPSLQGLARITGDKIACEGGGVRWEGGKAKPAGRDLEQ